MKPSSYHKWSKLNKISVCFAWHCWANQSLDTKSEKRQVSSTPKGKPAWPFQERRISMQGSCGTRYDLQVWRDVAAIHTKTALSSRVTYSGLWCLLQALKFQPSYKPGPTKSQRPTASTLMARSTSCLSESTPSWGVHITHRSVPQAWEPRGHGHNNKGYRSFHSSEEPSLLILQSMLPPRYWDS